MTGKTKYQNTTAGASPLCKTNTGYNVSADDSKLDNRNKKANTTDNIRIEKSRIVENKKTIEHIPWKALGYSSQMAYDLDQILD